LVQPTRRKLAANKRTLSMQKIMGLAFLMIGASVSCMAGLSAVPEVDPASAVGALALLAGGLLVIRGRRKK
jgi:LPXTG-motif cell wall-anchored protein